MVTMSTVPYKAPPGVVFHCIWVAPCDRDGRSPYQKAESPDSHPSFLPYSLLPPRGVCKEMGEEGGME